MAAQGGDAEGEREEAPAPFHLMSPGRQPVRGEGLQLTALPSSSFSPGADTREDFPPVLMWVEGLMGGSGHSHVVEAPGNLGDQYCHESSGPVVGSSQERRVGEKGRPFLSMQSNVQSWSVHRSRSHVHGLVCQREGERTLHNVAGLSCPQTGSSWEPGQCCWCPQRFPWGPGPKPHSAASLFSAAHSPPAHACPGDRPIAELPHLLL